MTGRESMPEEPVPQKEDGNMGSNVQMVLRSFGVILLSLGITATIIELLSLKFGTGHPNAVLLAVVGLAGGAVLFGAGTLMNRRTR